MATRNSNNKKVRRRRRVARDREFTGGPSLLRATERTVADQLQVELVYPAYFSLTNGAGTVVARRFSPNAAYDVDPTLGSTSTPGFAEYSALYYKYRIDKYSIEADIVNMDTCPIAVYSVNCNSDPGVAGTSYLDYACQPYCKKVMLSPFQGGLSNKRITHTVQISKLVGTSAVYTDDTFAALVTGVPVNLMWWGIGIASGSTNPATGVVVNVQIRMHVRFYDRKSLLTSFDRSKETDEFKSERQLFKLTRSKSYSTITTAKQKDTSS